MSRRYAWGLEDIEQQGFGLRLGLADSLFALGIFGFENSATAKKPASGNRATESLRDWFPNGGVLIGRHMSDPKRPFGVAIKGGHNNEHHNHNDVGTYLVAVGMRRAPGRSGGGGVHGPNL